MPKPAKPDPIAITDVRESVRHDLQSACLEARQLQEEIDAKMAQKRIIMEDIARLTTKAKIQGTVRGEGWTLVRGLNVSSKIVAEKLLQKGVKMTVIEFATEKRETPYWSVRGNLGKGETE